MPAAPPGSWPDPCRRYRAPRWMLSGWRGARQVRAGPFQGLACAAPGTRRCRLAGLQGLLQGLASASPGRPLLLCRWCRRVLSRQSRRLPAATLPAEQLWRQYGSGSDGSDAAMSEPVLPMLAAGVLSCPVLQRCRSLQAPALPHWMLEKLAVRPKDGPDHAAAALCLAAAATRQRRGWARLRQHIASTQGQC